MHIKSFLFSHCPGFLRPLLDRIDKSPLGKRLARGFFWSIAGTIISRGLMVVAAMAVARILGKTSFGQLGMIKSTVNMFGVVAGFGMGVAATKHVAQYRRTAPERAGRIIALSGVFAFVTGALMALTLFIFAPWVADRILDAPDLAGYLRIGVLILFINAVNSAQTGALSGFEAFKTIAVVNLVIGLFSFPIFTIGAYFGGLSGAVWGLAINLCINWLLNHLALRREARKYGISLHFRHCTREWAILWKFGLPAALASSLVTPVNWVCNAILVNQPNGYDHMGIYDAANQWFIMMIFFPSMLGRVLLPILSENVGQGNYSQSSRAMKLAIGVNFSIALPLTLVFSIGSPIIMGLYGAEFREGWLVLVIVMTTACILSILTPVGQIIAASGRMWLGFSMNLGWAVAFVSLTWLMKEQNALGLALARLLSYCLHSVWTFWYASSVVKKGRSK